MADPEAGEHQAVMGRCDAVEQDPSSSRVTVYRATFVAWTRPRSGLCSGRRRSGRARIRTRPSITDPSGPTLGEAKVAVLVLCCLRTHRAA